jgi:hypothetical protein
MDIACSIHGEMINAYNILVGKPQEKRQCGRTKSRQEDFNKLDLREEGFKGVSYIKLAEYKVKWQVFGSTLTKLWGL